MIFGKKKWDPTAKQLYVTGGQSTKGANLSIVAHPQNKLDAASRELEVRASAEALAAVYAWNGGQVPDAVFACAGTSRPMYLIDMTAEDFKRDMTDGFWLKPAAKGMARQDKKGKIILVSPALGYMSFVGYPSKAPLLSYDIDIDIFPPTMHTPGFDEESKTKPSITRKIDSTDKGVTAEQAVTGLLVGVQRGDRHITADLITSLFSASIKALH
ncbi:hypothetical protein EDD16DRAFT_1695674 [Pisolithus croceorrhizus]|nr:hypothetical protein EDD16DRAFT_1695674 [Pisolithus croceorrhizus]KAI6150155.1 hypothetical protein EDD17DRAFT_1780333 [Pisolithus thermaeus]